MKIAVLGAGGWGTALAALWRRAGRDVSLWSPFVEEIEALAGDGENRRYLPGVRLPEGIRFSTDHAEALAGARFAVFAVPSKYMGEIASRVAPALGPGVVAVSAAKGLVAGAVPPPMRMSQVLAGTLGARGYGVAAISGPSHAEEAGRGLPTTVVVAGDAAEEARDTLATSSFRVYTSPDLVGVELGGTLKNPIAIAAGLSAGLGAGDNAMGALVTRGIAEITRLGVAAGAEERTFAGLSGIGDLVATCVSRHSRNRRVGFEVAQGRKLAEVLSSLGMVAEGVETARIASAWARSIGVETPIISAVAAVLFEEAQPAEELKKLMTRTLKDEF